MITLSGFAHALYEQPRTVQRQFLTRRCRHRTVGARVCVALWPHRARVVRGSSLKRLRGTLVQTGHVPNPETATAAC